MGKLGPLLVSGKRIVKPFLPNVVQHTLYEINQLRCSIGQIREAAARASYTRQPAGWFQIVNETPVLRSQQIESEIVQFLHILQKAEVSNCLEIGTAKGGTLFMLLQAGSPMMNLISIDVHNPLDKRLRLRFAKQSSQKLHLIAGDSHSADTFNRVQRLLNGSALDLLFIDGDHTYAGVKKDFELYAPLVRSGGLIAFHDIVPDYQARFGRETSSRSGDVYQFWREICGHYESTEFVENAGQDGFGIGLLIK